MLSEKEWQRQVIELAQMLGWRVAHFRPARQGEPGNQRWVTPVAGDGKGFPDLVLARDRVIYAELKAEDGRLRPDQRAWLATLEAAGQETYVWKPTDADQVARVLR